MKAYTDDGEVEVMAYDFSKERDDNYTQMCAWPATLVEPDDEPKLQEFFKEAFGLEHPVHTVGCVITNPDKKNGKKVEGTGGRCDMMFFVHQGDIMKFAVPRLAYGIRWWEDVVGNKRHKIYPSAFLKEAKEVYAW